MQDLTTSSGLANTVCTEDPTVVIDKRDEQAYLIQRLDDGRCWMLDNLNLDLTNKDIADALTPDNTNADAASLKSLREGNRSAGDQYATAGLTYGNWTDGYTYSTPLANKSGFCSKSSTFPCTYDGDYNNNDILSNLTPGPSVFGVGYGKIGIYYNFCAASAGSYCYGNGSSSAASIGDATMDICPANWHLPSGGGGGEYSLLYDAIYAKYPDTAQDSSNQNSFQSIFSVSLVGNFWTPSMLSPGNASNQGVAVAYWSRSIGHGSSNYAAYHSSITTSTVDLETKSTEPGNGLAVRCILKNDSRSLSDITYMQDVNPDIVANTTEGTTKTLIDKRDNNTYTVAKINGDIWMTQNLRFSGSSLNSATSNVASSYTEQNPLSLSWTDLTLGHSYTTPRYHNSGNTTQGYWYNYVGASAGSVTSSNYSTVEAPYDICPASWHLPTYSKINDIRNYKSAFFNGGSPVTGGAWHNGTHYSSDNETRWWSSTKYSDDGYRYALQYNGSNLATVHFHLINGVYIRCIAK